MDALRAALRLLAAFWILVRADALLPREFDPVLSGGLRDLGRLLRLFAGPPARQGRPGERLARALERLGPVAIKFGQFLSTRADILGVEFAADLAHLKDRLAPFPTAVAKAEIEGVLGPVGSGLIETLGEPIAAASLAQAHGARLADGREAVVKILRPGIERRVSDDAAALRLGANLVHALAQGAHRLAPREFAATIIRALQLELDLRLEAAAADELREVAQRDGFMRVPRVVWAGVSRRILVLERAAGLPLSEPASLDQPGLDRARLATNLIRGFLAQALDHGVFHADLHEGNLFVQAPAQLSAVDFGIVGRLEEAQRRYLAEILWGFLQRDYRRLAEVHFQAGYVPADQDQGAFAQALRAVGEPVVGARAADLSMGRLLTQLFEVTALFEMALRPELVLLQKTMVVVEGVARRIDPDHDIWSASEPLVRRWMERELSPAAALRRFARSAISVARSASRLAEAGPARPMAAPETTSDPVGAWLGFAVGVAVAAAAFAAALLFR